jgi:hypothetical protein
MGSTDPERKQNKGRNLTLGQGETARYDEVFCLFSIAKKKMNGKKSPMLHGSSGCPAFTRIGRVLWNSPVPIHKRHLLAQSGVFQASPRLCPTGAFLKPAMHHDRHWLCRHLRFQNCASLPTSPRGYAGHVL